MDYRGKVDERHYQEIPWRLSPMKEAPQQTRIVLAEDHERVRQGIRALLEKTEDIIIVGEAKNGLEALQMTKELKPDVLLLDVEMPGLNGIEVARRLKEQHADVRILVLSAYDDQEYILELLDHEVSGYLIKGEAPEHIIDAVRGVARNEIGWVSPQVAMKLEKIKRRPGERNTLTYRELEILRWAVEEKTDEEIAAQLGIEPEVVTEHLSAVMRKLGTTSRSEALAIAKREGWA